MVWKIEEAEKQLGEVLDRATSDEPQFIERDGKTYRVTPVEAEAPAADEPRTFKELLLNSPSLEGIEFPRDHTPGREIRW